MGFGGRDGTYGGHGESRGDGALEVAGVFVGRGLGVGDDWEVGLVFFCDCMGLQGLEEG